MARAGSKTVRFTQVVERSGEPQVHTLWLPPDKDPELQRAQKAHRVMTISPGAGGKTDVGTIGFEPKAGTPAQFLIFPKSLKPFAGARVVGIKFDLVTQPESAPVDALKRSTKTRPRKGSRPAFSQGKSAPSANADRDAAPSAAKESAAEKFTVETTPDIVPFEPLPAEAKPAFSTRRRQHSLHSARAARKDEATAPSPSPTEQALLREVRAAMKDLERGKSVAAYQRLERAVSRKR